jgi:hypothetical protein
VVNEHTVDSALVAVEKPHRLVPVSHFDLHACIRAQKERFRRPCDRDPCMETGSDGV